MYEKYIQTYTGYDGAVYERYTLVLSGLTPTAERMIEVFYYIQYIFSFIAPVVCIFLYIVFFRKYAPSSYIWMTGALRDRSAFYRTAGVRVQEAHARGLRRVHARPLRADPPPAAAIL